MEEFESKDPYALIKKAQDIQSDYGKGVISNWWGDPVALMPLVNEKNIKGNPVAIAAPMDFEQKDSFGIYLARIKVALSKTSKTLKINKCEKLLNYLMSFSQDGKAKQQDHPALCVAGAIVHTLLVSRPWEQSVESVTLIPTTTEEMAAYEHGQTEKQIYGDLYGGVA